MDRLSAIYAYHCVAATIGYFLNGLLIVLIQKYTKRDMGKYNYLLLSFTIFNIAYPTIQLLAAPMVFAYRRSYLLISTATFIQNYTVGYILIIIYCTFYCQALILLMFQFVYRYLAVCHSNILPILHRVRALLLVIVFYISISALWGAVVHFALEPTPSDVSFLDEPFRKRYGISAMKLGSIGGNFEVQNLHGVPTINWRPYYGMLFLNTIMTASCSVIGYCGVKIYRQLEIMKYNKRVGNIQRELFKALIVQTIIPLIFQYLPCFVVYTTAIFGLPLNLEFTSLLVALDPIFEPICIMYFVKDYRINSTQFAFKVNVVQRMFEIFFGQRNIIEEALLRCSRMPNLTFSSPPMNLTLNASNPLWLQLYFPIFGVISFSINMLSLYCILKKSTTEMKTYKWFLLNIWFWSFYMDWFVLLFMQPISWFPLFGGSVPFKFAAHWDATLQYLLFMSSSMCMTNCSMSLAAGIFYRWQILYTQSPFLETRRRRIGSVIFIHASYVIPCAVVLWTVRPSEYRDELIRYHVINADEMLEYTYIVYHRDVNKNVTLAIGVFSFGITSVLTICGAMLADSYRLLYLIKGSLISEQTKASHKRMISCLVMQAVIPMTSYVTPVCAACLMILFELKMENMQEYTSYMVAVFCTHSTASCIVLLSTVKCYRTFVIKFLKLDSIWKINTVQADFSLATDSQ